MVTQEAEAPDSKDPEHDRIALRTPPGGARPIPSSHTRTKPIRRELIVDIGSMDLFAELVRHRVVPGRVIEHDLARNVSGPPVSRASAVLIAVTPDSLTLALATIEQVRAAQPHVGIYVMARRLTDVSRSMAALAAAGVDEVFCADQAGDAATFLDTLDTRLSAPPPETELRLVWKWFRASPERSLVMHCVRNGYRLDDYEIRSRVFDQCRKSIQNRVAALGLPSPGLLARCGRVLHAQELERRGVKPTELVAELLGFPSVPSLNRARRRLRRALLGRGRQSLVFLSLLT